MRCYSCPDEGIEDVWRVDHDELVGLETFHDCFSSSANAA